MSPDADMRAFREQQERDKAARLKRAVADVMDGDVSVYAAAKNRGVGDDALREALRQAGWVHPKMSGPRRRTFGNGAAKR